MERVNVYYWKYSVFLQQDLQHLPNTKRREHGFCRREAGLAFSDHVLMGFLAARGSTRNANTRQRSISENVCFSVQMAKERQTRLGMAPPTLNLQARDKKKSTEQNPAIFQY